MKRRAPIKHPISFWNMHVDAWRLSGLNQKEYCRRHGLRDKAFAHHKVCRLGADKKVPVSEVLPAKLDLVALPLNILSAGSSQNSNHSSGISITLGRNSRLEIATGFDAKCLTAVLQLVVAL